MKEIKTRTVGIIGLGHVGAHVAYTLAMEGIVDELILVDQTPSPVCRTVSMSASAILPISARAM